MQVVITGQLLGAKMVSPVKALFDATAPTKMERNTRPGGIHLVSWLRRDIFLLLVISRL